MNKIIKKVINVYHISGQENYPNIRKLGMFLFGVLAALRPKPKPNLILSKTH